MLTLAFCCFFLLCVLCLSSGLRRIHAQIWELEGFWAVEPMGGDRGVAASGGECWCVESRVHTQQHCHIRGVKLQ